MTPHENDSATQARNFDKDISSHNQSTYLYWNGPRTYTPFVSCHASWSRTLAFEEFAVWKWRVVWMDLMVCTRNWYMLFGGPGNGNAIGFHVSEYLSAAYSWLVFCLMNCFLWYWVHIQARILLRFSHIIAWLVTLFRRFLARVSNVYAST